MISRRIVADLKEFAEAFELADGDLNLLAEAGWRAYKNPGEGDDVLRALDKLNKKVLCKACHEKEPLDGDPLGRCDDCQDMVPTRRGGFRQLGVYDG